MKLSTVPRHKTMAGVWKLLSQKERAMCLGAIRRWFPHTYGNLHLGMLPFVDVDEVINACAAAKERSLKTIGHNLQRHKAQRKGNAIYLKTSRVIHFFGIHPERGKAFKFLTGTKTVNVGIKWSNFQDKFVPGGPISVTSTVALERAGKDYWYVKVDDTYRERVENWLVEHCR